MKRKINLFFTYLMIIAIIPLFINFEDPRVNEISIATILISIGMQLVFSANKKSKKIEEKTKVRKTKKKSKKEDPNDFVCDGITRGALNEILNSGRSQIKRIESVGLKIMDHEVRMNIVDICVIANDIYDDFVQDPKDIKESRRFINYYLETTEKIVNKYYKLANLPYLSKEGTASLREVENTLVLIRDAFKKHLKKLLDNDIWDLDAEIKVLKNTIETEGV